MAPSAAARRGVPAASTALPALLLLAAAAAALLAAPAAAAGGLKLSVDGQSVVDQLLQLATFTDDPNPAVTRILFTGVPVQALLHQAEGRRAGSGHTSRNALARHCCRVPAAAASLAHPFLPSLWLQRTTCGRGGM